MAYAILIPRLGWSMEEGTFVRWLKNDGDQVQRGEPLFELEGEKALQEIEAVDEGLLRIPDNGPAPGSVLKVGAIVGYLVAADEPIPSAGATPQLPAEPKPLSATARPTDTGSAPLASAQPALAPVAAPSVRRLARELNIALSQVTGTGRGGRILPDDVYRAKSSSTPVVEAEVVAAAPPHLSNERRVASPRARRVASEVGIDWTRLAGSGAGGRVRERDIRAAVGSREPRRATPATGGQRIPLAGRRRVIAERMVASRQQTVPVTLTTMADATNLVNLREQFKSVDAAGVVPSYQDIITKLVAEVLKRHPLLAARWDEDAIVVPSESELHLGMAVDTDEGLLVPVIHNVSQLSLGDLARQSRELIERARAGRLAAADMQGAVFTITNLGAFGVDAFTPIINSPEAAILGLGAIRRQPTFLDDGRVVAQHQLTLSLTFDHRVVDGAPAARFLQDVASAIANPSAWLLS